MPTLTQNRYGKSRVRFLKNIRHSATHHDVCELEADVLLSGDLNGSYLSNDNSSIVPTDTCKNTLLLLAHDHLGTCRNSFALAVGRHFLEKYPHLSLVETELRERSWIRIPIGGTPHPHAFTHAPNGTPFTTLKHSRETGPILTSGIRDQLVLKTTRSSFTGYNACDLTTLPPADDRFLSTRISAEWTFSGLSADFEKADQAIRSAILCVFAENHSPSVQRSLYEMGEAALAASPDISEIRLTLPNVHFLPLDLTKLGRPNQTILSLPTDEPHGQIQATIRR